MNNQFDSVQDNKNIDTLSELCKSNVVCTVAPSKAAYDDIGLSIADAGMTSISGNNERSDLTVSDEILIDELLSEFKHS